MPNTTHQPSSDHPASPWWGAYEVHDGHTIAWVFGPKSIIAGRQKNEWRIWESPFENVREPAGNVTVKLVRKKLLPNTTEGLRRYAFSDSTSEISITPCNADRPVVARPEVAVTIPPGEIVSLFISCPIWIQLDVHQPTVKLCDMPVYCPSDIWFGANTREGKLCYSSRTSARLHLENLPQRAQRAITPLRLKNASDKPFVLEKVNIPAPYLSLFANNQGDLWTEEVQITREADGSSVTLKVGTQPEQAPIFLSPPRELQPQSSLLASVSEWLG